MIADLRVPGSTSNLGSGFDCLGLAVNRWLRVTARLAPAAGRPVTIERHGTLADLDLAPERDVLYQGFTAACRAMGMAVPRGVEFRAESDIPIGRGLGSSAAARIAGAAAANLLLRLRLDDDALVALGAELEGHPDNVVPAVKGGASVIVRSQNGRFDAIPIAVHKTLALAFAVPDFALETARARAVLPSSVPLATAVEAAARAAALIHGLARADRAALAHGLDDRLHVPARRSLVPGYDAVVAAARAAGAAGATLSGSGSGIVAVAPQRRAATVARAMIRAWAETGVRAETFVVTRPARGYRATVLKELRTARSRAWP